MQRCVAQSEYARLRLEAASFAAKALMAEATIPIAAAYVAVEVHANCCGDMCRCCGMSTSRCSTPWFSAYEEGVKKGSSQSFSL